MAKPTKKSTTSTKVTRIKASDTGDKKAKTAPKITSTKTAEASAKAGVETKSTKTKTTKSEKQAQKALKKESRGRSRNPLAGLVEYFKGAWYEVRQVRWPDRPETWKMTGALLAFTGFFVLIILLLDMLFKYLFELIIG